MMLLRPHQSVPTASARIHGEGRTVHPLTRGQLRLRGHPSRPSHPRSAVLCRDL